MVQAFSCLLHKLPTGFTGKRQSPEAALGAAAVWCDDRLLLEEPLT